MKAKKFLSTIAILFIALISGCANDDVEDVVGVCPIVISTIPVDGASGVPLNQIVTATFNEEMNPLTINQSTFTVSIAGTPIAGKVTYLGKTATFSPDSRLVVNTLYTGRITTEVKDVDGNALQTDYVWTFTTGLNPRVESTDPLDLAVNVPLDKTITATFNMSMNPLSLNATSFTVKQGATVVDGVITLNAAGTMVSFDPTNSLAEDTVYTVTITKGATNLIGTELANDYVWTFKTGITPKVNSTDPTRDAVGVAINKVISATFNMQMNPLTLNVTTFTVKQNGIIVVGKVGTVDGLTYSFTPDVPLLNNTVYTGTITLGAQNTFGASMASEYTWSFTTVDVTPFVFSTDPRRDETGVALNKNISATFNMPMNGNTLNGTTFTVKQGTTTIEGVVSYSGLTATFDPKFSLEGNKVYTAIITNGAKNLNGTAMANEYTWNFTTTGVTPIVIDTDPNSDEQGVALGKAISATFNMAMNPLTVNITTFTVKRNGIAISGSILPNAAGTTYTFIPLAPLAENTMYTATITTGAQNTFGAGMANEYNWNFTTLNPIIVPPINNGLFFGVFGGSAGVTNQGVNTVINGNLGTTAVSTAVTGFHDNFSLPYTETGDNIGFVTGRIYTAPPAPGTAESFDIATQGLAAANALYLSISPAAKPGGTDPGAGELGGLTLAPGVYKSASGTFKISNGDLTLDAQGDPNAVWIFQTAAGLTVGIAGPTGAKSVKLINNAKANNVYWYVGTAATINGAGGGVMTGNIIASAGVTFSTAGNAAQTVLNGRAISLVASVTMVNTTINVPTN